MPWLGEIPEHWKVQRSKWLFRSKKELNADRRYTNVLSLTLRGVVNNDPDDPEGLVPKDYATYQFFAKGDLVFKLIDLENFRTSRVGLVHEDGIMSPAYIRLVPIHTGVQRYFFLQYFDLYQRGIFNQLGAGVRSTLGPTDLLALPIAFPDVFEQAAIVRFFDHVDRRIRRYIRGKQKLIKLLEEQKQAIIHRAVTRGIDSNVRRKPSRVEWLGDLPDHWHIAELRRVVAVGRKITYGIVQPGSYVSDGHLMIRAQDYSFGWASPDTVFRVSKSVELPYKRARLRTGDIVYTIVGQGSVGNVAVVPSQFDGANITQTTARISVDTTCANPFFVAAILGGQIGEQQLRRYVKGVGQPGINLGHLKLYKLPLPPIDEQNAIVDRLNTLTAIPDTTAATARSEIKFLREYCTRLIADVVTGKLDVREAVAGLPDEPEEREQLDESETLAEGDTKAEEDDSDVATEVADA